MENISNQDITKPKVVKEEKDENGNVIYEKYSNGFENWYDRDENGNIIHIKDSDGDESWYEYDKNGNCVHYKDSDGSESWNEYDENGILIHSRDLDINGNQDWYDYDHDEYGRLIYHKCNNGAETWYDENGNEIHEKDSNGDEHWMDYNEKGQCIHEKWNNGDECWNDYNENGRLIHSKGNDNTEVWYNQHRKLIRQKNSLDINYFYEYDKDNEHISTTTKYPKEYVEDKVFYSKNLVYTAMKIAAHCGELSGVHYDFGFGPDAYDWNDAYLEWAKDIVHLISEDDFYDVVCNKIYKELGIDPNKKK